VRARVAWILAALTVVFVVADLVITAAYRTLLSEESVAEHGFPFLSGAVLLTAVLGAVIVSRFGRHPIGWLLLMIGVTGSFSLMGEAYNIWVLKADGPGPHALAGAVGLVAAVTGGQLAISGIAMIQLLAPDGRLPSPRWRVVPCVIGLGELLFIAGLSAGDVTEFDIEERSLGPVRDAVVSAGFVLIVAGLCAALVSLVLRLRRSDGTRRQQLRLVAVGAALVLLGLVNLTVVQAVRGGGQTYVASVPLFAAFLILPVLHAMAVLRYRLHDVEVIVSAAVLVAVGTAFAAVGYVALVLAVRSAVDSRTGGWALSLAGSVVVALAFQPLRRWVVHLADRLAHGPRARPYVALSDFSSALVESPRPETLLPAVADAAGRAVSAQRVTAILDVPGVGLLSAGWGDDTATGAPYDVPVRSNGQALGSITVQLHEGRALRVVDAGLLQALADQAAMAFRNTALEAELANRVAELDRTTQQLQQSRDRLLDASLDARRALEAAISREVLPRLSALPDRIADAREVLAVGSGEHGLAVLLDDTTSALESLRELTRGVFPTQLSRAGLTPALRSRLGQAGLASILVADHSAADTRFDARVEMAVYFCCAEVVPALSGGSAVLLSVDEHGLWLRLRGVALDRVDLQGVEDRVAAVDGSLESADDELTVRVPAGQAGSPEADPALAHAAASRSGPKAALGT
jgi:hypothetical protein